MTEPFKLTRRKFALGALFVGASGVAAARQPSAKVDYLGKDKLEQVVPKQIGPWSFVSASGLVVPPEDQLSQATYSQLLTRVYTDGQAPPVMLLVAQSASQTGILQIHRPEFCYSAGGYALSPSELHMVQLPSGPLPALSIAATANGRTEQIVYWTRIGDHLPTSWRAQRIAVALDNLRGIIPDATMVRVSMVSNDRSAALATIDSFVQALVQSVSPRVRPVLIS